MYAAGNASCRGSALVIYVVGDTVFAKATSKVLSAVFEVAVMTVPYRWEEIIPRMTKRWGQRRGKDLCILDYSCSQDAWLKTITFVNHLRNDALEWVGPLVVIVRREEDKVRLLQADMFGGAPGGDTSFSSVACHAVFSIPFNLFDLIDTLLNLDCIEYPQWERLVRKGMISKTLANLRKMRKLINTDCVDPLKISECACSLVELVVTIDWSLWLGINNHGAPDYVKDAWKRLKQIDCFEINSVNQILNDTEILFTYAGFHVEQ